MNSISNLIWYEKHRPTKLSQLVLKKEYRETFEKFMKKKQIPHLLFHGPAGSGKTTLARIMMNQVASRKMVLNASSEDRGINTIKVKVKAFASSARSNEKKLNIILFDEADGLTADAQMALKNTIEAYHTNCRFIFTANEIDRITDPIFSRCMVFSFESMPLKRVIEMCESILKKEDIEYNPKKLKILVKRIYPDIRSLLNNLQSACITGTLIPHETLAVTAIRDIATYLDDGLIAAARGQWAKQTDFVWLYKWLFNTYVPDMPKKIRADAAVTVAEYLYRDRTVADREINATACCLELMSLAKIKIDFETPF